MAKMVQAAVANRDWLDCERRVSLPFHYGLWVRMDVEKAL